MAKHTGRRASHREESCAAFAAGQRRVNEAAQYDLALLARLIILRPRMAQKAIPNGLVGNQPSRNASVNCCSPVSYTHLAGSESDKLWDGKHRKNGFCRHADSMTPNPFKMVCRYFLGINPGKMHCPRPWFGLCMLAAWQPKNGNNTASHRFR